MVDKLPDSALDLDESILQESAIALQRSVNILGQWLDNNDPKPSSTTGLTKDYKGLAMVMRFDKLDINKFKTLNDKTEEIITKWILKEENPSIRKLLDILLELELRGILTNEGFIRALACDVDVHRERRRKQSDDAKTAQSKRRVIVDESIHLPEDWISDNAANETTTEDKFFDGFVCYAIEDITFVKEMINEIETKKGLNLCVDVRDFLVGGYKMTTPARVMEERCKRIIIILSPDFITTEMCQFQKEYALCLSPGSASKKVLPIMYRDCEVPTGLKHLNCLSYTNEEVRDWFWPRLAASLQADLPRSQIKHTTSPDSISRDIPKSAATKSYIMNRDTSDESEVTSSKCISNNIPVEETTDGRASKDNRTTNNDTNSSNKKKVITTEKNTEHSNPSKSFPSKIKDIFKKNSTSN